MEEDKSPRIEEDNSQQLLEKSQDAIRIDDEPKGGSATTIKMSGDLVESLVVKSAFDSTNRRIRQHLKDSRFNEARETIEKYIAENVNPLEVDIDELSRIYIRYVSVLKKQYDLVTLGKVFLKQVEPTLRIAYDQKNYETEARLLCAAQRIAHFLQFKD